REGTALTVPEKSRKDTGFLAPAVPGTPPVNHRADRHLCLRPVHAPSSFSRVFAFRHSTPAQVGAQSVASRLTLRVAQARLLARKRQIRSFRVTLRPAGYGVPGRVVFPNTGFPPDELAVPQLFLDLKWTLSFSLAENRAKSVKGRNDDEYKTSHGHKRVG